MALQTVFLSNCFGQHLGIIWAADIQTCPNSRLMMRLTSNQSVQLRSIEAPALKILKRISNYITALRNNHDSCDNHRPDEDDDKLVVCLLTSQKNLTSMTSTTHTHWTYIGWWWWWSWRNSIAGFQVINKKEASNSSEEFWMTIFLQRLLWTALSAF